jgi:hypothetical protein
LSLSPNGTNTVVGVRLIIVVDGAVIEVLVAGVSSVVLGTRPIVGSRKQKDYGFTHLVLELLKLN